MPSDVDGSNYVDGFSVDWARVATTIAGSVLLGWAFGVIDVIVSTASAVRGLIDGARAGVVSLIGSAFDVPADTATGAWRSATEFVSGFGVLGYVLAMVIVMAALWALFEGVSYVGS